MIVHDALAELFAYPGDGGRERILAALRALPDELQNKLSPFTAFVEAHTSTELEEAYTRTFDINPVCTLEVGWHLYGEDYGRGAFLVQMRERMRDLRLPEKTELPDHITCVLEVLGRINAAEIFARSQVVPAVNKMIEGFKRADDPYRTVVVALRDWLREQYGQETPAPAAMVPEPYGSICGSCGIAEGGKVDG